MMTQLLIGLSAVVISFLGIWLRVGHWAGKVDAVTAQVSELRGDVKKIGYTVAKLEGYLWRSKHQSGENTEEP
jgi:hypothetical protein